MNYIIALFKMFRNNEGSLVIREHPFLNTSKKVFLPFFFFVDSLMHFAVKKIFQLSIIIDNAVASFITTKRMSYYTIFILNLVIFFFG